MLAKSGDAIKLGERGPETLRMTWRWRAICATPCRVGLWTAYAQHVTGGAAGIRTASGGPPGVRIRNPQLPPSSPPSTAAAAAIHPAIVSAPASHQGLTLAHFTAQLEDPREHIAHVRSQLEHPQDTSTGSFWSYGGQSKIRLSGKGQSKLKLSGNGNECKPLPRVRPRRRCSRPQAQPWCRGLHSSTFQLNLSRFCHNIHPKYPPTPPDTS
jgi:hypothetical protein